VVIAQRRLIVSSSFGDKDVAVRLFQPKEDDGAWLCRYEINWPDGKWSSFAAGADSVQALVLALQKIAIELYTSKYHEAGTLKWVEGRRGYGFPVGHNVRDLLIGDDLNL
jgi:hypothetical protein